MDQQLTTLAAETGQWLTQINWKLATAESCTGGWVSQAVTAIPGSSAWFEYGFVTYSNEAKQALLGVSSATLQHHGAVSEATVAEMVTGALARSRADIALAVSGIAGPGGATDGKPVGTVCFAWGTRSGAMQVQTRLFSSTGHNDREAIRRQAVITALTGLVKWDDR